MGFKKDAPATAPTGKMTIAAICTFLQDEWRSHEAAKSQWAKERKTLLGRVEELELQVSRHVAFSAMADRRMRMLENVLRSERGYQALEVPALPDSEPLSSPSGQPSPQAAAAAALQQEFSAGSAPGAVQVQAAATAMAEEDAQAAVEGAALVDAQEAAERDADDEVQAVIMAAAQETPPQQQQQSSTPAGARRPPSPHPFSIGDSTVQDPEAVYLKQQQQQQQQSAPCEQQAAVQRGSAGEAQQELRGGSLPKAAWEPAAESAERSGQATAGEDGGPEGQPGSARDPAAAGGPDKEARAAGGKFGQQRAVHAAREARVAWEPEDKEPERPKRRTWTGAEGDAAYGLDGGGSSNNAAAAQGKPLQRPSSAGATRQHQPQAPTRFAANAGSSGFASNVGAGFQSDAGSPAKSPAGVGKALPAGSFKAMRPAPLRKPDHQEDIFAMAADLGILSEEDLPTSPSARSPTRSPTSYAAGPTGPSPGSPTSFVRSPETHHRHHHHHSHHHHHGHSAKQIPGRRLSFEQRDARVSFDLYAAAALQMPAADNPGTGFWHKRQPLRSHLAPIWDIAMEWDAQKGSGSLGLLTASEDGTLKLWSVSSSVTELPPGDSRQAPAGIELPKDLEPRVTLRGHSGPVTCLGLSLGLFLAYSGGLDGTIKVWSLPQSSMGLYSEYGSANTQLARTLEFHTDAVWSLAVQPSNPRRFVSAAADGMLRLWDTSLSTPGLRSYQLNQGSSSGTTSASPSLVRFTSSSFFFMAGFLGGQIARFDMATGDQVPVTPPSEAHGSVTGLAVAPGSDTLVFAAFEGGAVCRFDAGRSPANAATMTLTAHADGCSAVAVSHNSLQIATGSPSGVVRLWDTRKLDSHLAEAQMHDTRAGEGVLTLAFSPAPPGSSRGPGPAKHFANMLAAGGADGVVQLLALPP